MQIVERLRKKAKGIRTANGLSGFSRRLECIFLFWGLSAGCAIIVSSQHFLELTMIRRDVGDWMLTCVDPSYPSNIFPDIKIRPGIYILSQTELNIQNPANPALAANVRIPYDVEAATYELGLGVDLGAIQICESDGV
jgi:hypothetical protein